MSENTGDDGATKSFTYNSLGLQVEKYFILLKWYSNRPRQVIHDVEEHHTNQQLENEQACSLCDQLASLQQKLLILLYAAFERKHIVHTIGSVYRKCDK